MPRIKDFQPNTQSRAAAESLTGLMAFGIVADWDFREDVFYVTVPSRQGVPEELLTLSARDVRAFGKGALAAMAKYLVADEPGSS